MDKIRERSGKYIARIRKWDSYRKKNIQVAYISLETRDRKEAVARYKLIQRDEKDIKAGAILPYQFNDLYYWLNEERQSILTDITLEQAFDEFLEKYPTDIRESSVQRLRVSKLSALKVWGNCNIKDIDDLHIEIFKQHYKKLHSPFGINCNLRNIKTMLNWCLKMEYINHVPIWKKIKEPKLKPKYISEVNLALIMKLDSLSPFMKRAFAFYVSTGARRGEILEGSIEGTKLIVPPDKSKTYEERVIVLNDEQLGIALEIQKERDKHLHKGSCLKTFANKFTKAFKDSCEEIGIVVRDVEGKVVKGKRYNLHCLRHTFAIRQWIITNDILEVRDLLGHSKVTTTERYAKFKATELEPDFPIAFKVRAKVEKLRQNALLSADICLQLGTKEDNPRLLN